MLSILFWKTKEPWKNEYAYDYVFVKLFMKSDLEIGIPIFYKFKIY